MTTNSKYSLYVLFTSSLLLIFLFLGTVWLLNSNATAEGSSNTIKAVLITRGIPSVFIAFAGLIFYFEVYQKFTFIYISPDGIKLKPVLRAVKTYSFVEITSIDIRTLRSQHGAPNKLLIIKTIDGRNYFVSSFYTKNFNELVNALKATNLGQKLFDSSSSN